MECFCHEIFSWTINPSPYAQLFLFGQCFARHLQWVVQSSLVYFSIHLQKFFYTEVQKIFSCVFIFYINCINFAADVLLKFKFFLTQIHRCQDHNNVIVDDLRRASHHTPNSFCFIHVSCPRSQSWPLNCKYNKCCKRIYTCIGVVLTVILEGPNPRKDSLFVSEFRK